MMSTPLIRDVTQLCEVLGIAFSAEQITAITAPSDRPGVIVAGAGSGKTTVMAARAVWLVGHEGVPPGGVLGLTFTKKAAAELGRRIRRDLLAMADARTVLELFDRYGEPTVSTYHAFAGSLISEHGLRLGLETDLVVAADATRHQRAARVIRRYRGEPLVNLGIKLPATIERVLALDGNLSEHLVSTDQLRAHDRAVVAQIDALPKATGDQEKGRAAALARIDLSYLVDAYRADKLVSGVADFSDQMAGGARLAIECPEVGELMRERFGVVMLDEYQDTSVAQRLMLQGLFGGGHPVTAVGDPAQGIYGWRGASADNIDHFPQHFPHADGSPSAVLGLRTSRRCHPDVLAVANHAAASFYEARPTMAPLVAPDEPPEGWPDAEITAERFATVSEEFGALIDRIALRREQQPDESMAVLLRTKTEMPRITAGLRARGIDAEVVGLAGLLTLPHVADVVSLLDVVADATANPSLLRLLTGDRWRIGPRDLALLGRRAQELAAGLAGDADESFDGRLTEAVVGADPTEVVSLADALDDLGGARYSDAARHRFAEVAQAIRTVRRGLSGSVADVVRIAIRSLDLDVETALLDTGASADLMTLVDVADDLGSTSDVDSLPGFIAYLRAEEEFGTGLEVPERSRDGAVQVLTIHAAKGLEWDRVFVPFVVAGTFPSGQGRERWTSTSEGFPYPLRGDADVLPHLADWSGPSLKAFVAACQKADADEEVRLAYVAFTRAKRALHVSGHWWGRTQKTVRKESEFLTAVHDVCLHQGRPIDQWADQPEDTENPEQVVRPVSWPARLVPMTARQHAAGLVRAAMDGSLPAPTGGDDDEQLARLAELDREIELISRVSQGGPRAIPVPQTLSATAVTTLARDESTFARSLARPVPRRPSRAARFGTRFHAWIEAHYGLQPLLDPTDLPGAADRDLRSDAELNQVVERFLAGPYADRVPVAIEVPFSVVLGGQHVIGRIDAVFATSDGFEIVDWKTSAAADSDPLQLAIYRLAWAERQGVDLDRVVGTFAYVRLDQVVRYDDLPGRAELEALLLAPAD